MTSHHRVSHYPVSHRAVIFVNGTVQEYAWLRERLHPDDFLIGADGGARHCLALDRIPHVVVGDMDSIPPDVLANLEAQGVAVERHPMRKDKTDLELAIDRAVREGVCEILLMGALGGRLDQTLANLLISARRDWPVPIVLADGRQTLQVMRDGECFELDAPVGSLVSVVPLSQEVTGVTYSGLEYPLANATLQLGTTRGISNIVAQTPATISIDHGVLLVIQEEG
ncbi:MAG: thiamine diphosphokinase [Caldilineaceae bacterium]